MFFRIVGCSRKRSQCGAVRQRTLATLTYFRLDSDTLRVKLIAGPLVETAVMLKRSPISADHALFVTQVLATCVSFPERQCSFFGSVYLSSFVRIRVLDLLTFSTGTIAILAIDVPYVGLTNVVC